MASPAHPPLSRRAALAGIGASGLGVVLSAVHVAASGQTASSDLAQHPAIGAWLVMVPGAPGIPHAANVSVFLADGTAVNVAPVSRMGPNGVTFASAGIGRWESTGEYTTRLTTVQMVSDIDGNYLGTLTIIGHPRISEDGRSFVDDASESYAILRDPDGKVIMSTEEQHARVAQPVTATRFEVGNPGFPESTPETGTPAARSARISM